MLLLLAKKRAVSWILTLLLFVLKLTITSTSEGAESAASSSTHDQNDKLPLDTYQRAAIGSNYSSDNVPMELQPQLRRTSKTSLSSLSEYCTKNQDCAPGLFCQDNFCQDILQKVLALTSQRNDHLIIALESDAVYADTLSSAAMDDSTSSSDDSDEDDDSSEDEESDSSEDSEDSSSEDSRDDEGDEAWDNVVRMAAILKSNSSEDE